MKTFALIGKKLGHSLSAEIFNSRFRALGIDARYFLCEMENIDELHHMLVQNTDLEGFNVTVPYKQSIIPLLDRLSPEAEAIRAVNCVKIERYESSTVLTGFNTDAEGFLEMIPSGFCKKHNNALVLGTGGASKAAAFALRQIGMNVSFVSRTKKPQTETYADLNPHIIATSDIIVNTTPLGMWPDIDSAPPIDYSLIDPTHLCLDCVYNPTDTLFVRKCRQRGATAISGMKMLEGQAHKNASIWNLPIF